MPPWSPRVMWWSNFMGTYSGYGIQSRLILNTLHQAGVPVAHTPNWPWGPATSLDVDDIPVFPSVSDTILRWAVQHSLKWKATVLTPLYDIWAIKDYARARRDMGGKCLVVPYTPFDTQGMHPVLRDFLVNHTDYTISMSDHGVNLCKKEGIENVKRIWHMVDETRFRPWVGVTDPDLKRPITMADCRKRTGHSEDEFMILMNFMNKGVRKMVPENLEGVKLFKESNPDINVKVHMHALPLVDGGWDLYGLIDKLGLKGTVVWTKEYEVFTGLPPVSLAALYSAANVTLLASGTEGTGLPTLESMACGTPCIVTDYSAQTELVKPVAPELVVKPKALVWVPLPERYAIPDPEGICKALEAVLNSPEDRYRATLRAHVLENFSMAAVGPQWVDFYTKTLPEFVDRKCLDIPDPTWAQGAVKTWA